MSDRGQHSEWLSLVEVSGPFLAEPVLKEAFPQGLEGLDASKKKILRQGYDEWREALDLVDPELLKFHSAWISLVLRQGLELDEDGAGDVLKAGADLPETLKCDVSEHGVTLRPDYAVIGGTPDGAPLMLVSVYEPHVGLGEALKRDGWAAAPSERMVELCRATGVRLGLVTNGEHWMFVDAPVGAVTTFASWFARLWGQEPVTLQAFVNLLGIRRFFVDPADQLPALLDSSLKHQDEVTDALGEQVRRAVEVLIQALDRADVDRNRELLKGVDPAALYEAGLTVMMRIVFLLSAEERGLLLMGDERYEANYAVSTLRMQLRAMSEEILERRWDAWSRLLSIFRAVYGGIDHEAMRLPALGGSLFDPDRFPFLEGRLKDSHWKSDPATPLPIDNRTVLLLLDAVQLFQGRTLSYRALDVEQIGYVYEGLLERTASPAAEVTLDLNATKNAKHPWVSLPELDDAATNGRTAVEELLKERTGSSVSRVKNDLEREADEAAAEKLLTACHGDRTLRDRIKPYFHLLRVDPWGYPLVYPKGTFMVTTGTDRRETGTHYTPKSLTETLVQEALVPSVYNGPTTGGAREEWQLKSAAEILDLKICDPTMGSGAFLVQVCRWLSGRLVEAWDQAEREGKAVTSHGQVVEAIGSSEPMRADAEDRLLAARRLIAERCLYGVDVNPLAVELAKLSIWLVTLAKGRPFGFLEHNFRTGDSLLGIHNLEQLYFLDMNPAEESGKKLFASKIDKAVEEATALRSDIRNTQINDIRDIERMECLNIEARRKLKLPGIVASALIGEALSATGKRPNTTSLSITAGAAIAGDEGELQALERQAHQDLTTENGCVSRQPFHWPIEFPEVFTRRNGGFDLVVGNPPFKRGKDISGIFGAAYREYLVRFVAQNKRGSADLVAYFFLVAEKILRQGGCFGLLATNTISEGDTREVCLEQLLIENTIYSAVPNQPWPGVASVMVSCVHLFKGKWLGEKRLTGERVSHISAFLTAGVQVSPKKLPRNKVMSYQGSNILGLGFTVTAEEAAEMVATNARNSEVLYPYFIGEDLTSSPTQKPSRWVINFWDWPLDRRAEGQWATASKLARSSWLRNHSVPDDYPGNVAADFDQLLRILEDRVKPDREKKKRKQYREVWWQFGEKQKALYNAIGTGKFIETTREECRPVSKPHAYVLCQAMIAKYLAISLLKTDAVFSHRLVVFTVDPSKYFSLLQSSIHEAWVRRYGGTLETRMSYTPSDVVDTFPFPTSLDGETIGRDYLRLRTRICAEAGIGLTELYNRFHSKKETAVEYVALRELHVRMDEAVIAAYGWGDISLRHGIQEVGYLPDNDRVRFTISERAREEVLNRLLEQNGLQFRQQERESANLRSTPFALGGPKDGLFDTGERA